MTSSNAEMVKTKVYVTKAITQVVSCTNYGLDTLKPRGHCDIITNTMYWNEKRIFCCWRTIAFVYEWSQFEGDMGKIISGCVLLELHQIKPYLSFNQFWTAKNGIWPAFSNSL